jgi:hypothetical protein
MSLTAPAFAWASFAKAVRGKTRSLSLPWPEAARTLLGGTISPRHPLLLLPP